MTLEEIIQLAEKIRSSMPPGRFRWPKEFKDAIRSGYSAGLKITALHRATGVNLQTIRTWAVPAVERGTFEQVEIPSSSDEIILRWKNGLEVSGINFEQFCILLKEDLL